MTASCLFIFKRHNETKHVTCCPTFPKNIKFKLNLYQCAGSVGSISFYEHNYYTNYEKIPKLGCVQII
jgi:hypothetical protein